jgi:hypothetical protein
VRQPKGERTRAPKRKHGGEASTYL